MKQLGVSSADQGGGKRRVVEGISAPHQRASLIARAATIIEGRRHKKEPQAGYALGVGSSLVVSLRLLGLSGQGAVEAGGLAAQPGLMQQHVSNASRKFNARCGMLCDVVHCIMPYAPTPAV